MAANNQLKISFGGCGFLGVYHAGVGKCVKDHAPHLFTKFDTFYGASAGAITAVCAACKSDPMVPYKWVKKTFEASRKYRFGMLHPSFDLYTRLHDFLEGFLPKNAHRLARGRVKISLTTFPERKNWLVTDFNTRNELINVSLLNLASDTLSRSALYKHASNVLCNSFVLSVFVHRPSLQAALFQYTQVSKTYPSFVARYGSPELGDNCNFFTAHGIMVTCH